MDTTTATTGPARTWSPARGWSSTHILVALTAASVAVNIAMEVGVILLQPERGGDFLPNVTYVVLLSLVGLALTWGLVRLGQRGSLRTGMAWALAVLALVACALFYFLALPTTLAAGSYVLARPGGGSLRAARVVAILGIVASFVVSIAMLFTYV